MKILVSHAVDDWFRVQNKIVSKSKTYSLAAEFISKHPDIEFEIVNTGKTNKTYIVDKPSLDILSGFLQAKGGTRRKIPVVLPQGSTPSHDGKSLVASLSRTTKQLRAIGYDVKVAIREPAKEL